MKIILVILAEILLALLFVLFVSSNYINGIEYICPITKQVYTIEYSQFAALIYIIGGFSILILYAIFSYSESKTIAAYKRAHENSEIANAEKDSKILSLENKIKTLETALDNVLKRDKNNG